MREIELSEVFKQEEKSTLFVLLVHPINGNHLGEEF